MALSSMVSIGVVSVMAEVIVAFGSNTSSEMLRLIWAVSDLQ